MNDIKIFENSEFGKVRVTEIDNKPWFVLMDICKSLDISNSRDCKSRLKEDGVGTTDIIDNLGRVQHTTIISESNVYRCVFQSRKREAEKFQDWICDDVLPSIRKHGAYMTKDVQEKCLQDPDFLIQLATQIKRERQMRQIAEDALKLEKQVNEENAPKVNFANAINYYKVA